MSSLVLSFEFGDCLFDRFFIARCPKITTNKKFKYVEKELKLFYERVKPPKDKILALLMQLPPSYQLKEGLDFSSLNFFFKGSFINAVEVLHSPASTFLACNFFKNNNIAMV